MNIVYITGTTIPSTSANSVNSMKICESYARAGHDVTLIVPDREIKVGTKDPWSYYNLGSRFEIRKIPFFESDITQQIMKMYSGYRMAKEAEKLDADVIICRDVIAAYFVARMGLPIIYDAHGPMEAGRFRRVKRHLFIQLITEESFLRLVTNTQALKNYYTIRYPTLTDKTIYAANGATPVQNTESASPIPKRERLQVGYVGTLREDRGIGIIREIALGCPWADFHIVGGTEKEVEIWRKKCDTIENIEFHGYVDHNETDTYMNGFDIALAPYQIKTKSGGGNAITVSYMSPIKIFEYMASHNAILCSDLPVIKEVLTHRETVLLCDPSDADDWISSINELRDNKKLLEDLKRNSYECLVENYTWDERSKKMISGVDL